MVVVVGEAELPGLALTLLALSNAGWFPLPIDRGAKLVRIGASTVEHRMRELRRGPPPPAGRSSQRLRLGERLEDLSGSPASTTSAATQAPPLRETRQPGTHLHNVQLPLLGAGWRPGAVIASAWRVDPAFACRRRVVADRF